MTITVVKSIGTGKDFNTLPDFLSYAATLDLVALDQILIGELYENSIGQLMYANIKAQYSNDKNYLLLRPAAGLGVNDLDAGFDYGTQGITIDFRQGAATGLFNGVILEGFRISIPSTTYGNYNALGSVKYSSGINDTPAVIRNCRFLIQAQKGDLIDAQWIDLKKNLFFVDGAGLGLTTSPCVISTADRVRVFGNTFVWRNGSTYIPFNLAYGFGSYNNMPIIADNVIVGWTGNLALVSSTLCINNYTDNPNVAFKGFTVVNTGLIESLTDARPLTTGPLFQGGTTYSANVTDVKGINTGYSPDAGAIQRSTPNATPPSASTPFPSNLIMSDPLMNRPLYVGRFNSVPPTNWVDSTAGQAQGSVTLVSTGIPHYAITGRSAVNDNTENNMIGDHDVTIMIYANPAAGSTKRQLVYQTSYTSTISLMANADAAGAVSPGTLTLTVGTSTLSAPNVVDGSLAVYTVTRNWATGAGTIYRNGVAFPTTQGGTLPSTVKSNQSRLSFAYAWDDSSLSLEGDLYSAMALGRMLSDNEVASLSTLVVAGPDITQPTFVGTLTATDITMSQITVSWPAAADNIGVATYMVSFDNGGTYADVGNVLTYTQTGLTDSTTYQVKVVAKDAAGNVSAPLSTAVQTALPPDGVAPVLPGTLGTTLVGRNRVQLTWQAATDDRGVLGYEYSTAPEGPFNAVGNGLAYTVGNLSYTTAYTFYLRAYDLAGNRSNVISNSITTLTLDDTIPVMNGVITSSVVKYNHFTVSWSAATDDTSIDHYEVSIDGGTTYTSVGTSLTYTTSSTLSESTLYHVSVRAVDTSNNQSVPLNLDVTTPPQPEQVVPVLAGSITVTNITDKTYKLTWPVATDNVGVTGYKVSLNGGDLYMDVGNVLTYTATNQQALTAYTVKVVAYDAAENVSAPLTATVTTLDTPDVTPPTFVGTVQANSVTPVSVVLVWPVATDAKGVAGYEYSKDGGTTYVSAGTGTTATVTGLVGGTTYTLYVRAVDTSNNKSAPLSVVVKTSDPGVYSIGGPTRNFNTLADFCVFASAQDLTALGGKLIGEVYTNQSIDGVSLLGKNPTADNYIIIRPAAGLGVNDLEKTGAFNYGSSGIELTGGISPARLGVGMEVHGFRISLVDYPTSTSTQYFTCINTGTTGWDTSASRPPHFRNCRIKTQNPSGSTIGVGQYAVPAYFHDCLFVQESHWVRMFDLSSYCEFDSCTFVRRSGSYTQPLFDSPGNAAFISCSFVSVGTELTATTNSTTWNPKSLKNVVDSTFVNGGVTGFTFAAPGSTVMDVSNDYRPKAGGALIGGGAPTMVSTNDIRGGNRGTAPDIGACQLNPSTPLAIGTIASAFAINGQTLVLSGTVTNNPTVGTILLPADTVSYGASSYGPFNMTLSNGTFTVTIDDIPPGNYGIPTVVFSNAGGISTQSLGSKLEINGVASVVSDDGVMLNVRGNASLPNG